MNDTTAPIPETPENLTTEQDVHLGMVESLRCTAMLADVTIGMWSGEVTDREARDALAEATGADKAGARVIKNLMVGADQRLRVTKSAFAAVRAAHRMMTQPWVQDLNADRLRGPRLLPNILFEHYLTTVGTAKRHATDLLEEMLKHYDADKAISMAKLGGIAREQDYPTADELRKIFYVKLDFEPLPAHTDFKGLPPHFASKLAENLRGKQEKMMGQAQDHLWRTLRERLDHGIMRFEAEDATFKDSTVDALQELVKLIPGWNILQDPRAGECQAELDRVITGAVPKVLRKDGALRASTAKALRAIRDKLDEWDLGKGVSQEG